MNEDLKKDIISEIQKLKKEKNAIILAHNYQRMEVQEIADFTGDSLELSRKAKQTDADIIVFAGVRFMAETAKILSPDKKVLIPRKEAGCPMADMVTKEDIIRLRNEYPDATFVAYINTNASVKAEIDVCCTSSNCIDIVRKIKNNKIVFVPDKNLGWWIKKNVPEKEIILFNGYCYVHEGFEYEHLKKVREKYPDAEIIVHPECPSRIVEEADFVYSTSNIIKHVLNKDKGKFVIGTEVGVIEKLKKQRPDLDIFSLGPARVCYNMKLTMLYDIHNALLNEVFEITLPPEIIERASSAIERMVQL